jgi:hypothetical protein
MPALVVLKIWQKMFGSSPNYRHLAKSGHTARLTTTNTKSGFTPGWPIGECSYHANLRILGNFSLIRQLFNLGSFLKNTALLFGPFFQRKRLGIYLKIWATFWATFRELIWSPWFTLKRLLSFETHLGSSHSLPGGKQAAVLCTYVRLRVTTPALYKLTQHSTKCLVRFQNKIFTFT